MTGPRHQASSTGEHANANPRRSRTRISTEIDFTRPGRQFGFLSVPYSEHRSAYGRIQVPIACLAGGQGPTALLVAGNHGDEYEGQVALSRLSCVLDADAMHGRVIILSAANLPAAAVGMRTSPIDGGNLNRLFPGDPDGDPSAMIAHYIESELLILADLAVDLHSGGSSLEYLPCAIVRDTGSDVHVATTFAMLRAFGPELAYLSDGYGQGAERTFHSAADRANVPVLTTELGGGGRISRAALELAEGGVRRVLQHFGILDGDVETRPAMQLFRTGAGAYTPSPEPGVFEPSVELGDRVEAGELAGYVHAVDTPGRAAAAVRFHDSGLVICRRAIGRTQRGDCLFGVVKDAEWPNAARRVMGLPEPDRH